MDALSDMSLKAFHLLFIIVSTILAAFTAAWALGEYQTSHEMGYIAAAVGALASAAVLVVYGAAFQRKMKRLS